MRYMDASKDEVAMFAGSFLHPAFSPVLRLGHPFMDEGGPELAAPDRGCLRFRGHLLVPLGSEHEEVVKRLHDFGRHAGRLLTLDPVLAPEPVPEDPRIGPRSRCRSVARIDGDLP